VAKFVKSAQDDELKMAHARKDFDWELQFSLAFDQEKPRSCRERKSMRKDDMCTMCGEFCAIRLVRDNI
jgi:phosphomethylpyrimidine synthase